MFPLQLDVADAFGSVDCQTMWKALTGKVGSRKAWPLARLIFGTSFNIPDILWCGHADVEEFPMMRGGRQGTVEHILGEVVEKWSQRGRGVGIPRTAVGQSGGPAGKSPPLHKAEHNPHLNQMVGADGIVLVYFWNHGQMIVPALLAANLDIKWERATVWRMSRADTIKTIKLHGHVLEYEENLKLKRVYRRRTGHQCQIRCRLERCSCQAAPAHREVLEMEDGWKINVAPVPSYAPRGKLWRQARRGALDVLAHRIARVIFGIRPRDTESWLEWNRKPILEARDWVL